MVAQAAAALAALWFYRPTLADHVLLGWLALVALTLLMGILSARALANRPDTPIARAVFALAIGGNALLWGMAAMGLGVPPPETVRIELWTVIAILMATWAVVPAMPQATVVFTGLAGGSAVLGFATTGNPFMAGVALAFCVIIVLGAVQTSRDFLASRLAEAGLAEHREVVSLLLREFEEEAADWLWETDAHRRVHNVSARFAAALAQDRTAIAGRSLLRLIAGEGWATAALHPGLYDLAHNLRHRQPFSNLLVQAHVAGQTRWWELSGKPRFAATGAFTGFRGVGSDVTTQRESSDKIAWLARYDTLTGLPNRLMLTEAIGEALRHAHQHDGTCAFLMIDLDRFKAINDTLGHLVGDQLLAAVSERLQSLMGPAESCGRLGGDEFAVVIRELDGRDHLDLVASSVIDRLSEPYTIEAHTLYVGASVGSAIAPRDGSTVETLMRSADLALYRAKGGGGGRHCTYEPGLHARAEERRALELALRHAIDRGELLLNYQPVVDAADARIIGFEALVRWQSPEHGLVNPGRFIPIAEDTRLIVPIGDWVLRAACLEARRWPADLRVAVNVSGEQLLDPGFLDGLVTTLAETGLPPQRLDIEATESIFLRDANTVRAVLERALALGCGVSLDDFGTGYSSLGYLRTLRFSTVKVDRGFVQGAATGNLESLAIIRAVVAMAESLEMSTTAEGVETEAELALVRRLGCRKAQGYHFGRPMSAEEAAAMFGGRAAVVA